MFYAKKRHLDATQKLSFTYNPEGSARVIC
jgi:hypothetical protein